MTQSFKITVTVTPVDEQGKKTSNKRLTLKNFKGTPKRYGGPSLTRPKDHPHKNSFKPSKYFNPADLEK